MKNQIKEMLTLSKKNKSLRINQAFTLNADYIAENGFNVELTNSPPSELKLTLVYTLKHDKCFMKSRLITSRNVKEVIDEIAKAMQDILQEVSQELVKSFINGQLLGDVI